MGLSDLQERVTRSFFALAESAGFALAGGGALVALQLVDRSTKDIDLFATEPRDVGVASEALVNALRAQGLSCDELRRNPTFVRLRAWEVDGTATEIDLAYDPPWQDTVMTPIGPARSPKELAVDKLLALFGRAQARDFVDVYFLARRFGIDEMIRWAPEKDAGFDEYLLAEGLGSIARFPRQEFDVDDAALAAIEEFYAGLRADLLRRALDGVDGVDGHIA